MAAFLSGEVPALAPVAEVDEQRFIEGSGVAVKPSTE